MAVLLHSRDGNVEIAAFFDKRQQFFVQIIRVPAKIVVGIGADNAVKELLFKGQVRGVRFDRNDLRVGQSHFPEEPAVFLRVAPQVRGVDRKAVFLCQKHAGQALPAAQVTDHAPGGYQMSGQQFFLQFQGIWPHDFRHDLRRGIFFTQWVFHTNHLFRLFLLILAISRNFFSFAAR